MDQGYDWAAFAFGFGAAVVLVLILRWRATQRSRRLPPPPTGQERPVPQVLPELKAQLILLRAEGRSIDAIKLLRNRMGLSLNDAKDVLDNLR